MIGYFSGQVVIIVNVASECGLANANYTQLKTLQDKYYDQCRGERLFQIQTLS